MRIHTGDVGKRNTDAHDLDGFLDNLVLVTEIAFMRANRRAVEVSLSSGSPLLGGINRERCSLDPEATCHGGGVEEDDVGLGEAFCDLHEIGIEFY